MAEQILKTRKKSISAGDTSLGIELGSTRIKAVLIDKSKEVIAQGDYEWENKLVDGIWTYSETDIWQGVQGCFAALKEDVEKTYGVKLTEIGALGFSAMMHGYLPFNSEGELLTPFRTWRNTRTLTAARKLSALFQYNIPQRWSIAHLYQAILDGEEHVGEIDYLTTLAGYVHWRLTGERVLGIGDASGMFPIKNSTKQYDEEMAAKFEKLIAPHNYNWQLFDILPEILMAGDQAGTLTKEGALLLDPTGELSPGVPLCPPEGDAGTGMVATNSVAKRTGNVSAGTSIFAMVVLEKDLNSFYEEIDMVTTPAGDPAAMVHCNNFTSDLNAWVALLQEFAELIGVKKTQSDLFPLLFNKALEGDGDGGGLLAYCYLSGEHITGFEEGRPLFARLPDAGFNLANFMRTHLYTAFGALRVGMDILFEKEEVEVDQLLGHGGFFKTKEVGQKIMAAALHTPVSVMETAGEGGAWGIALLADFMQRRKKEETLAAFLAEQVFAAAAKTTVKPDAEDVAGFNEFFQRYLAGLPIQRAAVDSLK